MCARMIRTVAEICRSVPLGRNITQRQESIHDGIRSLAPSRDCFVFPKARINGFTALSQIRFRTFLRSQASALSDFAPLTRRKATSGTPVRQVGDQRSIFLPDLGQERLHVSSPSFGLVPLIVRATV